MKDMTKHIHADLIHAWADGAEIQFKNAQGNWVDISPTWNPDYEYRIKPRIVRKKGWVNVFPASRFDSKLYAHVSHAFATYDEAIANSTSRTLATLKIEWEEEEQ